MDEIEKLAVPRFSLAERDRRWRLVRELMAQEGLDVIVTAVNTGHWDHFQANTRYLTGIGGNCGEASAVFPLQGEVTAIAMAIPPIHYWLGFQDWITDVRNCNRYFGRGIVERLRELGVDEGRIGIAGLYNISRAPEGVMPYGTMRTIEEALPNAKFVDATDLMERAKYVKSQEEIDVLARSVELVEKAIDAMAQSARPGVPECAVYAAMIHAMVEQGGELPTMLQWSAGPEPHGNNIMPTLRPLQHGDIVMNEIEARWLGYVGQGVQPMFMGQVDRVWHDIFRTCQEILQATYEIFRPGLTTGELNQFVVDWGKKHSSFMLRPLFHGRGLGDDAPVSARATTEAHARWQLEENVVFILKPTVATPDGRKRLYWGDCVVCTPRGARRLGKRPVKVIEIQ
jgi:Xaa-Pro aminopeptidase